MNTRQLYPVTRPAQCIEMLIAGHANLFYTSEIGMEGLLKEKKLDPGRFKALLSLKKEYLYIAFSKDVSDARIQSWQAALEDAKRDGTVSRLYTAVYPDGLIKEVCRPGDPLARP
jgi:polar amino acid transport system substrate-binding protein